MSAFHELFAITPGRELDAFPLVVRRVLDYHELASPEETGFLDDVYVVIPEGRPRSFLPWLETLAADFPHFAPQEGEPPGSHMAALSMLTADESVVGLALLLETRLRGTVEIPQAWTVDTRVMSIPSTAVFPGSELRRWWIHLRDGMSFYQGQQNVAIDNLLELARHLFSRDEERETAALNLWDDIGGLLHRGDMGGVIDGLGVAAELPPGHYRVCRIVEGYGLLASPVPALRHAAADLLERHAFPELIGPLRDAALSESAGLAAEAQIRALRCTGGEAGFDALLDVARGASLPYAAKLAARALAWVQGYPEAPGRIRDACRSRDSRTRAVGATALSEGKYHSVHAYGGALASRKEREDAAAAPEEARPTIG